MALLTYDRISSYTSADHDGIAPSQNTSTIDVVGKEATLIETNCSDKGSAGAD